MKVNDITIEQIHMIAVWLRDSLPYIGEISVSVRTRSGTGTDDGKEQPFYWSLYGDIAHDSPLSKNAHCIHASGYADQSVKSVVEKFRDDYKRAISTMIDKTVSLEVADRLIAEFEDKNLDMIDGPTVAAIAKEAA